MKAPPISAKKKRHFGRIALLAALLLFLLWMIWGNVTVKTTRYTVDNEALPPAFDGFRIAHISDLHNAEFGKGNTRLLQILQSEQPDLIALTGDLVDANHTDLDIAVAFAEQAVHIAPCYYVTGNHEAWLGERYKALEQALRRCGVTVLRNQAKTLQRGGDSIQLIGIDDPDFATHDGLFDLSAGIVAAEIESAASDEGYRILLSHRPEVFEVYTQAHIHLALCGHAHGGQFRLPLLGGLVAPNQGFFPKYDSGTYTNGLTTMVVSRGIGNSIIPVRFNNRPEVVIITLQRA